MPERLVPVQGVSPTEWERRNKVFARNAGGTRITTVAERDEFLARFGGRMLTYGDFPPGLPFHPMVSTQPISVRALVERAWPGVERGEEVLLWERAFARDSGFAPDILDRIQIVLGHGAEYVEGWRMASECHGVVRLPYPAGRTHHEVFEVPLSYPSRIRSSGVLQDD